MFMSYFVADHDSMLACMINVLLRIVTSWRDFEVQPWLYIAHDIDQSQCR